jgi:hypothetical protein
MSSKKLDSLAMKLSLLTREVDGMLGYETMTLKPWHIEPLPPQIK